MSSVYIRRLIESGKLKAMRGREILTLIVLLNESEPGCWFSFSFLRLAEATGQHRQTVAKAIAELASRGILEHIPGYGRFQLSKFRILSIS